MVTEGTEDTRYWEKVYEFFLKKKNLDCLFM